MRIFAKLMAGSFLGLLFFFFFFCGSPSGGPVYHIKRETLAVTVFRKGSYHLTYILNVCKTLNVSQEIIVCLH